MSDVSSSSSSSSSSSDSDPDMDEEEEQFEETLSRTDRIEKDITRKRVLIITTGSRGDVQPFVAIANGLVEDGYQVAFATHDTFRQFLFDLGPNDMQFYPLKGNPAAILGSEKFRKAFFGGGSMKEQSDIIFGEHVKFMKPNMRLMYKATKDFHPDILLSGIATLSEVLAVGQKLCIPVIIGSTIPAYPSSQYCPTSFSATPLRLGFANSFLHWFGGKVVWTMFGGVVNEFRQEIKLPPQNSFIIDSVPHLCLYSSTISPRPTDWPPFVQVSGFCINQSFDDREISEALVDFLEEGDPPVYIGFGSMPLPDVHNIVETFKVVMKKFGLRGIFCGGWTEELEKLRSSDHSDSDEKLKEKHKETDESEENFISIKGAPHEWLFPQCSIAIHHGGAGTSAASFRAGIPTIIFPVLEMADQPYWAERAAELGLGPPQVYSITKFNEETLTHQIRCAKTDIITSRSKKMGKRLRKENGVENVVEFIDKHLLSVGAIFPMEGRKLVWQNDADVAQCNNCATPFSLFTRRHHCRACGQIFCFKCLLRVEIPNYSGAQLLCIGCEYQNTA